LAFLEHILGPKNPAKKPRKLCWKFPIEFPNFLQYLAYPVELYMAGLVIYKVSENIFKKN